MITNIKCVSVSSCLGFETRLWMLRLVYSNMQPLLYLRTAYLSRDSTLDSHIGYKLLFLHALCVVCVTSQM